MFLTSLKPQMLKKFAADTLGSHSSYEVKVKEICIVAQPFVFATYLCHQCFATFAAAAATLIFAGKLVTLRRLP